METTLQTLISTLKHEPEIFHHFVNQSADRATPMLVCERNETRHLIVFYDQAGKVVFSCEADFKQVASDWKSTAEGSEVHRFTTTRPISFGTVAVYDLDFNLINSEKYSDVFCGSNTMAPGDTLIVYDLGFRLATDRLVPGL